MYSRELGNSGRLQPVSADYLRAKYSEKNSPRREAPPEPRPAEKQTPAAMPAAGPDGENALLFALAALLLFRGAEDGGMDAVLAAALIYIGSH